MAKGWLRSKRGSTLFCWYNSEVLERSKVIGPASLYEGKDAQNKEAWQLVGKLGLDKLVAKSDPMAWDSAAIRSNATDGDRVFVVFRGRTYEDQPTWLTVPYYLWSRLERELGMRSQAVPLLSVIATAGCGAERLPWSELS